MVKIDLKKQNKNRFIRKDNKTNERQKSREEPKTNLRINGCNQSIVLWIGSNEGLRGI